MKQKFQKSRFKTAPTKRVTKAQRPGPVAATRSTSRRNNGLENRITSGPATEWYPYIGEWELMLVRAKLYAGMQGSFSDAFDLFSTMLDRTPRLFVNMHEVREGASTVDIQIVPFARLNQKPTDEANERASFIDWALRQFRPETGTDETGLQGLRYDMLHSLMQPSINEFMYQRIDNLWVPRAAAWVHSRKVAYDTRQRLGIAMGVDQGNGPTNVTPLDPLKFCLSLYKTRSGSAAMSGLMRQIAPVWAMAEFGKKWLFDYMQKFGNGIPMIPIAPGTPDAEVDAMEDWAKNFGANAYLLYYQYGSEKPDIWESKQNAEHLPMSYVINWSEYQYDLVMLGEQRMSEIGRSTQRGSSEQANALKKVKNERVRSVAKTNAMDLKESLVRSLLILNYGNDDECPDVQIDISESQDPAAQALTIKTYREAGYKLEIADLVKETGLPLVEVALTSEVPGSDQSQDPTAEADNQEIEQALPEPLKGKFRNLVAKKKSAKQGAAPAPVNGKPNGKSNGHDGIEAMASQLMRERGGMVFFADASKTDAPAGDVHDQLTENTVSQYAHLEATGLEGALERARAIGTIEDENQRKTAAAQFEKDLPEIWEAMSGNRELRGNLTIEAMIAALLNGMAESASEISAADKGARERHS